MKWEEGRCKTEERSDDILALLNLGRSWTNSTKKWSLTESQKAIKKLRFDKAVGKKKWEDGSWKTEDGRWKMEGRRKK